MKTHNYVLISALILTCGAKLSAQNKSGEIMFSAGAGYSNLITNTNTYSQTEISVLPELNATVDYFVISNYSIGGSVAYQSYSYNYFNNYPQPSASYTETTKRVNFSIRSLVYFTKDNRPGLYGGIRLGYEYWYYDYSGTNPNQYNPNQPTSAPTLQVFLGARASITPGFSTYLELGTGNPFYAELGFSFNIGGSDTKTSSNKDGGIGEYGTPPPLHH